MRVLFVNRPDADSNLGGDTVQMRQTAAALRGLGVEVEERLGPQDEATYRDFELVHLFNLQTPRFSLAEAHKIKAAGRPLALSTIFWDFGAEYLLAASRKWSKIASVLGKSATMRLLQRRVDLADDVFRVRRQILELADLWLPNSEAEIPHLRRHTPAQKPVHVIPNGIDADRFDPARELPRPTWADASQSYVLVAARIDAHKNQVAFCRALQGFDHPIILAGGNPEPDLVRQCESYGAVYVGPQSGDDLVAAYAHARVHALPSFRETPGLASLEAAAMGCAVVTTADGSTREYFLDQAAYCDPRSEASMRAAVANAWQSGPHPALAARIRRDYSWTAAAEKTLAAYRALTGSADTPVR